MDIAKLVPALLACGSLPVLAELQAVGESFEAEMRRGGYAEIAFQSERGKLYQVYRGTDLIHWEPFGPALAGTGGVLRRELFVGLEREFFEIRADGLAENLDAPVGCGSWHYDSFGFDGKVRDVALGVSDDSLLGVGFVLLEGGEREVWVGLRSGAGWQLHHVAEGDDEIDFAFSPAGTPTVVWTDGGMAKIGELIDGTWQTGIVGAADRAKLGFAPDGTASVALHTSGGAIEFRERGAGVWGAQETGLTGPFFNYALCGVGASKPTIAARLTHEIRVARREADWVALPPLRFDALPDFDRLEGEVSIACDPSGALVVYTAARADGTDAGGLIEATLVGDTWHSRWVEVTDGPGWPGQRSAVSLLPDGRALAAYVTWNNRHLRLAGTYPTAPSRRPAIQIVDGAQTLDEVHYPSMAALPDGTFVVAYAGPSNSANNIITLASLSREVFGE